MTTLKLPPTNLLELLALIDALKQRGVSEFVCGELSLAFKDEANQPSEQEQVVANQPSEEVDPADGLRPSEKKDWYGEEG